MVVPLEPEFELKLQLGLKFGLGLNFGLGLKLELGLKFGLVLELELVVELFAHRYSPFGRVWSVVGWKFLSYCSSSCSFSLPPLLLCL